MPELPRHPHQSYPSDISRHPHQSYPFHHALAPSIGKPRELEFEQSLTSFMAKLLGESRNEIKNQLAGNLAFLLRRRQDGDSVVNRSLIDLVVAHGESGHWCLLLVYNGAWVVRGDESLNRDDMADQLLVASARAVTSVLEQGAVEKVATSNSGL